MRVPLSWLNDYIDLGDLSSAQVATTLTDLGLEVEAIDSQSTVGGELVVGRVETAVPHPNADSLRLCTVNVGAAEPLRIVCGAPNARPGISVVVAKIGAVLPGDFKIKKAKIRGEESSGMMCSAKELGLGEDHAGIIELPAGHAPGQSAARLLGLEETVFELKVTPNRADCLGLIGIARDLAAKLGRPLREPGTEVETAAGVRSEGRIRVEIADEQMCPRFVALRVEDVPLGPSPAWLQKRLTAAGMRPINLPVDATNYAMLEYGQPVHAYDERRLRGGVLRVATAAGGEMLTTLDGTERRLESGDIVIRDGEGVIGLAGIMGGASSEVQPDTKAIVIEVAAFAGHRIRRTARRLALHTEASHRFERGTDVDALPRVAQRVAGLLARAAGELRVAGQNVPTPKIAADYVDSYPAELSQRVITLRLGRARSLLALPHLSADDVKARLTALEFQLLDANAERMVFEVPWFRQDIMREADLIEEVGRLVGYDQVPYRIPPTDSRPLAEDPFIEFQESVRTALAMAGYRETISFPFAAPDDYKAMGLEPSHPLWPSLALANPIAGNQGFLQTTLAPGLIRALSANQRHGNRGVRLFECGRGHFAPDPGAGAAEAVAGGTFKAVLRPGRHLTRKAKGEAGRPVERHWAAGIIANPAHEQSWDGPERAASFFDCKASVVALLRAFGAPEGQWEPAPDLPWLHPGASAVVKLGTKVCGWAGELHPRVAAAFELSADRPPVLFELDLEVLFDQRGRGLAHRGEINRFPPVTRDLALLADSGVRHADFERTLNGFRKRRHLTASRLFDVYQGPNLPPGKKSMAYALSFQSPERTLTDAEVDAEVQAIVGWLGEQLGVTLR